jgi:hypothetical protein
MISAVGGGGGGTTVVQPQGRLTLVTGVAVMASDQTAKGTIYWTPYVGNQAPIYSGSAWSMMAAASDVSYTLSASAHLSGNLYDLFLYNNGGTLALGTSPAWTNSTARSNAIAMLNGIWTNNASIVLTVSGGASTTTVAANQATYVGTFYATANGQTGMAFTPTPAAGGTNNILGLYNAYNRINYLSRCADSTASWTYGATTWRATDNSASNRISWVDGLRQSPATATYQSLVAPGNGSGVIIGVSLDSTTAAPDITVQSNPATPVSLTAVQPIQPQIGFHYAQAMEVVANATTATFFGAATSPTRQLNGLALAIPM